MKQKKETRNEGEEEGARERCHQHPGGAPEVLAVWGDTSSCADGVGRRRARCIVPVASRRRTTERLSMVQTLCQLRGIDLFCPSVKNTYNHAATPTIEILRGPPKFSTTTCHNCNHRILSRGMPSFRVILLGALASLAGISASGSDAFQDLTRSRSRYLRREQKIIDLGTR